MWRPQVGELGQEITVGPYLILRHLPICEDGQEGIGSIVLFGSYAGIRRLVDGRVEPYQLSSAIYNFKVTHMFRDHDGGLWVGTAEHGLVHIHPRGRTDVFSQSDNLSGDYVERFFEDREGIIWVATQDGVDRFRAYTIPTISTRQGLSNTVAWSVLASKDGSVWIGTNSALNRWKNGQISLFGRGGGTQKPDGKLNGERPKCYSRIAVDGFGSRPLADD